MFCGAAILDRITRNYRCGSTPVGRELQPRFSDKRRGTLNALAHLGTEYRMEFLDCSMQAFAVNKPCGIKWAAIRFCSHTINRNDPRMFQLSGDLGLTNKSLVNI